MKVKYNDGLKTLLQEGLLEPEFYGDLVYKFRKIVGKTDFFRAVKKIQKIGYNIDIDILRQTACIVVCPIAFDNFASLFNCTTVGQSSD